MTNVNIFFENTVINPMYIIGILILIGISIVIVLKKKLPVKIILIMIVATIIIFVLVMVKYTYEVMPKKLITDEIHHLEKVLVQDYTEVNKLEVRDVGGVELSFLVSLSEDISEALAKEILNKIRIMLIGKEFENSIQKYYWSKYYNQHSFEVKYVVSRQVLYTFYAKRGVQGTNLELYEWDGSNHFTKESVKVILK